MPSCSQESSKIKKGCLHFGSGASTPPWL